MADNPPNPPSAIPELTGVPSAVYGGFLAAPRGCAPLPLWFWNAGLREDCLLQQLEEIARAGCAGAIIYARHGLRTPYLSDEWIRLVGVVCHRGRETGLRIWVADDENWPGGVGPEAGEAWYLKVQRFQGAGVRRHVFQIPGQVLAACAFVRPPEGTPLDTATVRDLTADAVANRLEWTPPDEEQWEILAFTAHSYPHGDLLADGAGERLLNSTHRRYEARLGDLAAAGLAGFFSDDLAPVSVWDIADPEALPWTPALEQDLWEGAASGPASLLTALLPLAVDTAGAAARRQRFWSAVAGRYHRCFFRPVKEWLEARGLEWAGHLLFEEPLLPQMVAQADLPLMLGAFTLPVADNLMLRPGGLEQTLAASVAHEKGRPAAIESFGGAGWGLDLADRRKAFDLQLSRGADRLIPHGIFYSSAGKRKAENPPSEFLREPFAPLYPEFAAHVRRLSWLFSQGRSTPLVGLLYPLRSAWATYRTAGQSPLAAAIEADLELVSTLLDEVQYEYALLDEAILENAEVIGDRLRTAAADYSILALPSCTFLSRMAWEKLLELYENGGKVVCLGMLPEGFEDGPNPSLPQQLLRLAAVEVAAIRNAYLLRNQAPLGGQDVYTFTRKNPAGGRFSAFQAGLATDLEFARGEVRQILNGYCPPDLECRDLAIRYRRRTVGGLDLYWIINTAETTVETRVAVRSHGSPEIWDPATGARSPLLQFTWLGANQTVVTLRLQPGKGVLLAVPPVECPHVEATNVVLTEVEPAGADLSIASVAGYDDPSSAVRATARLAGPPQAIWRRAGEPVSLEALPVPPPPTLDLTEGWEIHRVDPNVLVLEEWRYRTDERGGGRILQWHRRPHEDWNRLPERRPITWAPEPEPIEAEISSFVWYQSRFSIQEWDPGRELWLALETIDAPFRVWVDGMEEATEPAACADSPAIPPALSDPALLRVNLTGHASTGHHTVTLLADYRGATVSPSSPKRRIPVDLVPGRARLTGDFSVLERPRGLTISSRLPAWSTAGDWTRQGCPHYSGAMKYRRPIALPAAWRGCRIFLELGSVASGAIVRVNGKEAASLPWPPFRCELTALLSPRGVAELEVEIRNTRANALLGRSDPSGLLGPVALKGFPVLRLVAG